MKQKRNEMERLFMYLIGSVIVILIMIITGWANARTVKPFYSFPNAKFIEVIDGDTIRVTIPSVHPIFGHRARIRVLGIDTPELRSKIPSEREAAKLAKEFTESKLVDSKRFRVFNCLEHADSFGRPICQISSSKTKDLGSDLLKAGLAKPYKK